MVSQPFCESGGGSGWRFPRRLPRDLRDVTLAHLLLLAMDQFEDSYSFSSVIHRQQEGDMERNEKKEEGPRERVPSRSGRNGIYWMTKPKLRTTM
jgi:hypothetical protein